MFPRRKSCRLKSYDYSRPGVYHVTICVDTTSKNLSRIESGQIILSDFGEIIKTTWEEIPSHYRNCTLDEYVIMPDHMHGIIFILGFTEEHFSLSNIIGGFKSTATKRINKINNGQLFKWEKSFHDNIIFSKEELIITRKYILQNPKDKN